MNASTKDVEMTAQHTLRPHGATTAGVFAKSGEHCLVQVANGDGRVVVTNEEMDDLCVWWAKHRTNSEYLVRRIVVEESRLDGVATPPPPTPPLSDDELLATLRITRNEGRQSAGGRWVSGTIAGHTFEALVFPEHAECESYELGDSRISKLWLREQKTKATVANFERGWDIQPATDDAKRIVDLIAAGLAETVFGK